jgi:hypothetical protein
MPTLLAKKLPWLSDREVLAHLKVTLCQATPAVRPEGLELVVAQYHAGPQDGPLVAPLLCDGRRRALLTVGRSGKQTLPRLARLRSCQWRGCLHCTGCLVWRKGPGL